MEDSMVFAVPANKLVMLPFLICTSGGSLMTATVVKVR